MRPDAEHTAARALERRREGTRALRDAVDRSAIARFPPSARERLLRAGSALDIPAGAVIFREGGPPEASLVVRGVVRIFKTAGNGHELTLRYARPGYALGLAAVAAGAFGAGAQALTRCSLLTLPLATLEELADSDAAVSRAIAQWTARLLTETAERLMFMWRPLPQRVALAILDIARVDADGRLVAGVSQRELANATGAARESVARILRALRADGIVDTFRDRVTVLRTDALVTAAAEPHAAAPSTRPGTRSLTGGGDATPPP